MTAGVAEDGIDLAGALERACRRLDAVGLADPLREVRVLARAVLGLDAVSLIAPAGRRLSALQAAAFGDAIDRRARREPFARIVGEQEFWSLPFGLGPDTLVPRPDSETVIEAALGQVADRASALSLLDLGTGTGCLLLALLSELPHARGIGVDLSHEALAVATANSERLGLSRRSAWICGDWTEALGDQGRFNLIVANPPYVANEELAALEPEVARFEPRRALAGGEDGLDAFRAIAPVLPRLLAAGGVACLEVGIGQAPRVAAMLAAAGLQIASVKADLAGIPRCVVAVTPP